jgi:hypothetical protein
MGCRKVSAVRVPKSLNEEQAATRTCICLEHLLPYERGDEFLARIIGGGESWCLQYDLET